MAFAILYAILEIRHVCPLNKLYASSLGSVSSTASVQLCIHVYVGEYQSEKPLKVLNCSSSRVQSE